jgi:hypothetical protein
MGERAYLVTFPGDAEALYLAGITRHPHASAAQACVQAIRDWLDRLTAAGREHVSPQEISAGLGPVLARAEAAATHHRAPACGPFAPGQDGRTLPGRVHYLGGGMVRLDPQAVASLAALDYRDDFRISYDDGPALIVGSGRYPLTDDPTTP